MGITVKFFLTSVLSIQKTRIPLNNVMDQTTRLEHQKFRLVYKYPHIRFSTVIYCPFIHLHLSACPVSEWQRISCV